MLNILADSMMTATRSNCVSLREVPPTKSARRRRWFAPTKTICVDLEKL